MSERTRRRWTAIADDLRGQITSGVYVPGSRLPTGSELMARYGVARQTVQNAVDQLRAEGLVVGIAGGGWFVTARRDTVRMARTRLSRAERSAGRGTFLTDAKDNFTPDVTTHVYREDADDATAALLQLPLGSREVVVRSRVMRADHAAVQLATSRFPASIAAGTAIEDDNPGPGGVYARLEDLGHALTRFVEDVGARAATPAEAATLDLAYGAPVLDLTRIAYAGDTPVEVNEIILSSDRYRLVYELPAE